MYRKNTIAYVYNGAENVKGLSPPQTQIALAESFRIWEKTVADIQFSDTDEGICLEPFEIAIEFCSFQTLFPGSSWSDHKAHTENNCTTDDDEYFTIRNSTIYINTDHVYKVNDDSIRNANVGVNIVPVFVKEIGAATKKAPCIFILRNSTLFLATVDASPPKISLP